MTDRRTEAAIAKARLSVAQMVYVRPADGAEIVIGTGFLVGQGRHLITANHVVEGQDITHMRAGLAGVDYEDEDIEIRAAFIQIPVKLVAVDAENDIALLELQMPPDAVSVQLSVIDESGKVYGEGSATRPMRISTERVVDGTEILVSGFPLHAPALVSTRGIVASTFAPDARSGGSTAYTYLCDVTAIHGNSGGPVHRISDGSVIGVCIAVKLSPDGTHSVPLTVVTPAKHVVELMRSNGVNHVVPAPAKIPPKARRR